MRPLIIVGSILALLVLGKLFIWDKKEELKTPKGGSSSAPAQRVSTISVSFDNSDQLVYSSGTLAPNEEVELRSEYS